MTGLIITTHTLHIEDFARLFGTSPEQMPGECRESIAAFDFRYRLLPGAEREAIFRRVIETLEAPLEVAGGHRKERWERGWTENLNEFIESGYDLATLVPKFVRPNEVVRLNGNYVEPLDPHFETGFVTVLRQWLFTTWFEDLDNVYEFGCGTAHNLVALGGLFPRKTLHGLDWARASQRVIELLVEHHGFNMTATTFDLFSPDPNYRLAPRSGVFTIGTMEQLGATYRPFLDYLLNESPAVCINVETLYELYDQTDPFDDVAARYLRKRGYLQGYLAELRRLESEGHIEIISTRRTFGSLYHDGYSFVVWKPAG